VLPKAH